MTVLVHPSGLTQRLAVADLRADGGGCVAGVAAGGVDVVYSDPPWSPGNERWWRGRAGATEADGYGGFLDAWCRCVAGLVGLRDVFVEQSANVAHRDLLLRAVGRCVGWTLPLLESWGVHYGSPRRPNVLLHFGTQRWRTDPSGLSGEAMTRRVFEGLPDRGVVADPCLGLGMTSRVAHRRGWDCVGTELDPRRLDRAIAWLRGKGYVGA